MFVCVFSVRYVYVCFFRLRYVYVCLGQICPRIVSHATPMQVVATISIYIAPVAALHCIRAHN